MTPSKEKSAELSAAYKAHEKKCEEAKEPVTKEVRFRRVWCREQLNKLKAENTESSRAILENIENVRSKKDEIFDEMEEDDENSIGGESEEHKAEQTRIAKAREISK